MEGNYASGAAPHLDSAHDCLAIMKGFPTTGEVPFLDGAPSLDDEEANFDVEVAVNGPIMALVLVPIATDVPLVVFTLEFLDNLAQVYDVDHPVVLSAMHAFAQAAAKAIANNVVHPSMTNTSKEDMNASSFPPAPALANLQLEAPHPAQWLVVFHLESYAMKINPL
ncbi:hypothetical protein AMTR_s00047p00087590 [Amborella trichopoda]|uniref:Uncharacterized protein n=1 Tax=Amborella trichopoda TaxID=13333 RepID=U5D8J6_AMBTC|nr:hypothetical protein AMTR_s00047p00087590 [Amborella trichopoda]